MTQLQILIEKAALIAGSEYKLAKELGTPQPVLSAWKSGKRPCSAPDRAAIADYAGENAAAEALEAIIESVNESTPKGKRAKLALQRALMRMRKL